MGQWIRCWAAGFGTVAVLAAVPAAITTIQTAGISRADVCADAGGRHVDVGGCTDVPSDAAVAGDDDAAAQAVAGQPPCYTPTGVPYYTPGDAPCN